MPTEKPELRTRLAGSGLDVPEDRREAIVEAAAKLAAGVERLRAAIDAREGKAGSS